jgi:hypothetical protein
LTELLERIFGPDRPEAGDPLPAPGDDYLVARFDHLQIGTEPVVKLTDSNLPLSLM